jgi:hypothetical protein
MSSARDIIRVPIDCEANTVASVIDLLHASISNTITLILVMLKLYVPIYLFF